MDDKKKTENIWGLKPPGGPCAPQKFSTPGDMRNKFCEFLEKFGGMVKNNAGLLVQTECFLSSIVSRSNVVVIPPKYQAEIVKGFQDRLALEGVAPEKIEKQAANYSAKLKARWAEKGGALVEKSGAKLCWKERVPSRAAKRGKPKRRSKRKRKPKSPKSAV